MTACTNLLVKRKEYLKQVIFDFWRMVSICNPERLSYTKKMYSLLGVCFWTWVTKNIPYLAENLILFYRRYVVWCYRKESFIFNNSSLISLRELGTVAWSNLKFKIPWITERWSYLLKIPHVSEVLASFQRHYLCNRKCLLLSGQKCMRPHVLLSWNHELQTQVKIKEAPVFLQGQKISQIQKRRKYSCTTVCFQAPIFTEFDYELSFLLNTLLSTNKSIFLFRKEVFFLSHLSYSFQ